MRRDLYRTLSDELAGRGESVALDLAARGGDHLLTGDLFSLHVLLQDTQRHNPDMLYAFVVDSGQRAVADTFPAGVPTDLLLVPAPALRPGQQTDMLLLSTDQGLVRDVRAPILGGEAGWVRVGMGEGRVMNLIGAATRRLLYVTALAGVVALAIGLLFSRVLVRPLGSLVDAMRAVAGGDLSRRVVPQSDDEIGFLAASFNTMSDRLQEQMEESRVHQEGLERTNRELRALQALSEEAAAGVSPRFFLERAVRLSVETLSAAGGWICLRDPEGDEARLTLAGTRPALVGAGHRGEPDYEGSCALCLDGGDVAGAESEASAVGCPLWPEGAVGRSSDSAVPAIGGCALTAPIPLENRTVGFLTLLCTQGGLIAADAQVVTAVARQIGLVRENLHLRLEREAREERLGRLLSYTLEAQESERARIARELHDDTGQKLTYLKLGLKVLQDRFGGDEGSRSLLGDLRDVATQSMESLRDMAVQLRPPVLDDLGLLPAFGRLLAQSAAASGFVTDFEAVRVDDVRLTPEREVAAYRIVQEALTNAARHAQCRRVGLVMERQGDMLAMVIEDDGVGFDAAAVLTESDPIRHLGLDGMRERADLAGGNLWVESSPGAGTTIHVRLPLSSGGAA
jgi:signal transduction histidine kinase/HAMP domain-containing protein